jgi:hypothetical protein
MNADREALEQIRADLEESLRKLASSGAPAGIGEHIELALRRLNSFLEMINDWEKGNNG